MHNDAMTDDPLARRNGEGKRAYAAYLAYRDMGVQRSLAKVGRELGKSTALMERWSGRYGWVARADAYDADLQQQIRLTQIAAVADMNERHVNLARAMLGIVARRLQSIVPEDLSPADTVRWAEALSKLERLARGEATERVDVFQRVRELAREMGYTDEETRDAVAAAEQIIRGGNV